MAATVSRQLAPGDEDGASRASRRTSKKCEGTGRAEGVDMVGRCSLLVLALLGGCVCEPDHLVDDAYAPAKPYGAEIDACITRHDCDPLCLSLFALGPDQSLVSCAVENVDAQGTALVEMRSEDYGVCAAQDSGYYGDDGSTDTGDDGSTDTGDDGSTDTGDDGSCNDSSCDGGSSDDGSTDTGDDGSTDTGDDGSTDDGSTDDGSTDDGGDSGDGGDSSADWVYRPGSTPVKAPAIHALHVSRART